MGWDPNTQQFLMHDPYGRAEQAAGGLTRTAIGSGKAVRYSHKNWGTRWQVDAQVRAVSLLRSSDLPPVATADSPNPPSRSDKWGLWRRSARLLPEFGQSAILNCEVVLRSDERAVPRPASTYRSPVSAFRQWPGEHSSFSFS